MYRFPGELLKDVNIEIIKIFNPSLDTIVDKIEKKYVGKDQVHVIFDSKNMELCKT